MIATVTIETDAMPIEAGKMNTVTGIRMGPIITVPPFSKLVMHVFDYQGLAIREKPSDPVSAG
jgi:hypothetical protein